MAGKAETAGESHITQSEADFEAEFGLESNDSIDPGEVEATESGDAVADATQRLLDLEMEGEDNVERFDRLQREAAEKEAAEDEVDDTDDDPDDPDDPDDATDDSDDAEEEDGEEEDEARESATAAIRDLSPEAAQALLEQLVEAHGANLTIAYKANGEEVRESIDQVRNRAAGYRGTQAERERWEREKATIDAERQRVDMLWNELDQAYQLVKGEQESLARMTSDPQAFVDQFLMQRASREFLLDLRDQLELRIDQIERNPDLFDFRREIKSELSSLREMFSGQGRAGVQSAAPEPRQENAIEGIPEDFGYIPGRGFPESTYRIASKALEAAAKVAGIDFDTVLDAWDEGGRQESPFNTLERLHRARYAETAKVDEAKKRSGKKRPKNTRKGLRTPNANPAARKHVAWDDIEGIVRKAVQGG